MPDSPDLEEIIATNPKVDRDQLNEERELLRSMRRRRTRGLVITSCSPAADAVSWQETIRPEIPAP